jgi:hypothetical protein
MASLRLHMIVPLAVLGLLGAAVGVFMVGKKPPDQDSGVPLITTHPEKKSAAVRTAEWTATLEAWCAGVDAKGSAIPRPQTIPDFESVLGEYVQLWDSAQPAFIKLGLPPKQKQTAIELQRNIARTVKKLRALFNHAESLDAAWIQSQFDNAKRLDSQRVTLIRRLGAGKCLKNRADQGIGRLAIEPAPLLITAQLNHYSKVVVLFYKPDASYDAIQTREARAGALAAHAGFVAVDVSKNREVAQLAAGYDVLESPTVLIFARPLKLKARIVGLYDRKAVLQAVRNA